MKRSLTLAFCAAWLFAFAQGTPTKTEILDSYSDKVRPLFGSKAAAFKMSAVRTTDTTGASVTSVLVEVATEVSETVATSTSVAFGSGSSWAVGSGALREIKKESGRRVLDGAGLARLIGIFNTLIHITGEVRPEVETLWRFDYDEGFSVALSYRPGRVSPYTYVIAMDGAVYEVETVSGLSLLKKLAVFRGMMR